MRTCSFSSCSSRGGFGLLEMLVAALILATLCSLALPSFRRSLDRLKADSLRMQLVSVLSTARSTAIVRQQRIDACPSSDGMTCGDDWSRGWLLYPGAPPSRPAPPGSPGMETLLVEQRAPSRVRGIHTARRPRIQFRPDGRNAGKNQTIYICLGDYRHSEVVVNVPGRVRSKHVRRPTPCRPR